MADDIEDPYFPSWKYSDDGVQETISFMGKEHFKDEKFLEYDQKVLEYTRNFLQKKRK
jgi:hypothetical protein